MVVRGYGGWKGVEKRFRKTGVYVRWLGMGRAEKAGMLEDGVVKEDGDFGGVRWTGLGG